MLVCWHLFLFILLSIVTCREIKVNVKQGTMIGIQKYTVFEGRRFFAFYRVPYAQPPVKKLRFKDPVAPKKWTGRLDASLEYHGACAQPHIVHKQALYGSEDCLYLNIYTPHLPNFDTEHLKPVIVWIHGYAFTSSFSHIYGPDFFIDNDVILVTVTHRIGPFGFLKVNETDSHANMGLKDIVRALKWIKKNIKSFAGDYKRVTAMGNGSAATLLSWLLMTKARNLFSRMILQSGALFSASLISRKGTHELERLSRELHEQDVKNVLKASTQKIISASQKIYSTVDVINYQRPLVPFVPIKETKSNKSLITMLPDEFFGRQAKLNISLPILIGYNSEESISEVMPFIHNPEYLKIFSSVFKFMVPFSDGCKHNYSSKIYDEIAIKIKNEYFKDGISENSVQQFLKYISDLYKYQIHKFIDNILKLKSSKLFTYIFNFEGTFNLVKSTALEGANVPVKGAASGDEICYLLKCEPVRNVYANLGNDTSNNSQMLIQQMAQWWTNFAKFGEPTPDFLPSKSYWPAITLEDNSLMLIGRKYKLARPWSDRKSYTFWNTIYDNYYRTEHCNKKIHDEL